MNCIDLLGLLTALEQNRGKNLELKVEERSLLSELENKGFISRVQADSYDPRKLERLKVELARIQKDEKSIAELNFKSDDVDIKENHMKLKRLDEREQELRSQILLLSELSSVVNGSVAIQGIRYIVTYKGKELLASMIPRIKRIERSSVENFEMEMAQLMNIFTSRAKRSFEILKSLSPRHPDIDEIHLRSAVVGLSLRPEDPGKLTTAFVFAISELRNNGTDPERLSLVAECIILTLNDLSSESISSGISKFNKLYVLAGKYSTDRDSALDCALILYPLNYSDSNNDRQLRNAQLFANRLNRDLSYPGSLLEPVLLTQVAGFELNDEIKDRFQKFYKEISSSKIADRNSVIATALLLIGVSKRDQFLTRFDTARIYLDRFSENTMTLPAAMLAFVASEVEETLDTLRLASSAIAGRKLSLGGMENLSLGMKMLLQSSILFSAASISPEQRPKYFIPREIVPLPMPGIFLPSLLPIALTVFTAFHEIGMHKLAVSDYRFHPVHRHFIYG